MFTTLRLRFGKFQKLSLAHPFKLGQNTNSVNILCKDGKGRAFHLHIIAFPTVHQGNHAVS